MKAMILAAGLGTRLAPYSLHTPKPLFTINGRTVLDRLIRRLQRAGSDLVIINTHHLHERIESHLSRQHYSIPVVARHEPEILGTGGGIRNIADLWDSGPLLVVNADIVSDINPAEVYTYHREHEFSVTMVMHDHIDFNTVRVKDGFILSFDPVENPAPGSRAMAFTGIQVIDRSVLEFIPEKGFSGIIDAYRRMLEAGGVLKAFVAENHYWRDMGTPASYQAAVFDLMAPAAFKIAFGSPPSLAIKRALLQGDGSDRQWYRLSGDGRTLIMVDHGLREQLRQQEVDAFVAIGRHLRKAGAPVPRIYSHDPMAGLVFIEDLGDQHLQQEVAGLSDDAKQVHYQNVIDQWITMAMRGYRHFDPKWTCQSTHYDRELILEKECRYFTEAFLRDYCGWTIPFKELAAEFERLADGVAINAAQGFIHRDLQSRNVMVRKGRIYFIDFQGGRLGPVQYDLASLLIDPYVALPLEQQQALFAYGIGRLVQKYGVNADKFEKGYRYCAVTRNLQILGAFAFLSRAKGKQRFEAYIPTAIRHLQHNLACLPGPCLTKLTEIAAKLMLDL